MFGNTELQTLKSMSKFGMRLSDCVRNTDNGIRDNLIMIIDF